jgi:hypothetical protein
MGFVRQMIKDFKTGFDAGYSHGKFLEFLGMDRQQACHLISDWVTESTPEELDQLEAGFMSHSSAAVMTTPHRLRAMELYAYLKLRETAHYGRFRGFMCSDGPL